jgi:predicted nucleic acid-binding protein
VILLDTNIVSEFMGTPPDLAVRDWLDRQNEAEVYLSSVSVAEILTGISALPKGRRRDGLERDYMRFRATLSDTNILAFDEAAAIELALVVEQRRARGHPIDWADAQIASIASTHGLSLATRNTKDFEGLGIALINPFKS